MPDLIQKFNTHSMIFPKSGTPLGEELELVQEIIETRYDGLTFDYSDLLKTLTVYKSGSFVFEAAKLPVDENLYREREYDPIPFDETVFYASANITGQNRKKTFIDFFSGTDRKEVSLLLTGNPNFDTYQIYNDICELLCNSFDSYIFDVTHLEEFLTIDEL